MSLSTMADFKTVRCLDEVQAAPAPKPHGPIRIDSLTGIRGIAAVWVLLTHFQAVLAACLERPAIADNTFLYNGFRGVDLFFVLSGFILMHVHADEFRQIRAAATRRFYVLRFFRVYPLNAAVLLALVALVIYLPGMVDWFRYDAGAPIPYHDHDFSRTGFVQSLLLAQAWTVVKLGEWNGPAWSLSAEVFAYALFPALAWTLMRARWALLCVAVALASLSVLMALLTLGHHTQDSPTGTFGLIRCVFAFIAGAAMARAFHLRKPWSNRVSPLLAWASLGLIGAALLRPDTAMFVVFGFTGLIYALAAQRGLVNAVMASGPVMFLGRISFSLYMVHYVPLKLALWLLPAQLAGADLQHRILALAAVVAFCLALAMLAYACIELPFQRLARAVLRRRREPPLQAALAP